MKVGVVRIVVNVLLLPVIFPVIFVLGGVDACFGAGWRGGVSHTVYSFIRRKMGAWNNRDRKRA